MNEYGALVEWYWQGKAKVLGEKPNPVSLFPQQIPRKLKWDRAQKSEVTAGRLTAWIHHSAIKCDSDIRKINWMGSRAPGLNRQQETM